MRSLIGTLVAIAVLAAIGLTTVAEAQKKKKWNPVGQPRGSSASDPYGFER